MADRIHVVPANLREAAGHHQETSEYLRNLPSSHQAWIRWDRSSANCGRPDAHFSSKDACATSNRPTTTQRLPTA